MKIEVLCIDGGKNTVSKKGWLPALNETLVNFHIHTENNPNKGRCERTGCRLVNSCTGKVTFAHQENGLSAVLTRRANTYHERRRQEIISKHLQLHDDVEKILRDHGM